MTGGKSPADFASQYRWCVWGTAAWGQHTQCVGREYDNLLTGKICKHETSQVLANGTTTGRGGGGVESASKHLFNFLSKSKDGRGYHGGSAPLSERGSYSSESQSQVVGSGANGTATKTTERHVSHQCWPLLCSGSLWGQWEASHTGKGYEHGEVEKMKTLEQEVLQLSWRMRYSQGLGFPGMCWKARFQMGKDEQEHAMWQSCRMVSGLVQ